MKNKRLVAQNIFRILTATEKSGLARQKKMKLAEIILEIRYRRQKKFGLFVIFGWKNKWTKLYADTPDSSQDIFLNTRRNIFNIRSVNKIIDTLNFDGAILIDAHGAIRHSGIILEGLRPRQLALRVTPSNRHSDLSEQLGFKKKVHARHLSAIAASWEFKDTTVYTVSEETGDMHIFEKGCIIFSTVSGEDTV